jgi:hypothetical protein
MKTLILLLGVGSTAAAQGANPAARRPAAAVPDIPMDQLGTVAGRVRVLRATPASITMRVGQTIPLDSVRVYAVDANVHDIGRLRAFNFAIKPGEPASAVPRQFTGVRPGTTTLRVSYPSAPWGKRTGERPAATVNIVVKP